MALFKSKQRFIGVDISPTAIKVVELSRSGARLHVEAVGIEPMPEGAVDDRNPTNPELVAEAIKRALRAAGTRQKLCAAAVPTSAVITRSLPLAKGLGDDEIAANIQIEASQYIPFPLDEIYLDHAVVGPSRNREEMNDVMIVASRKEIVDQRKEAIELAGLTPVIMDVESYALENWAAAYGKVGGDTAGKRIAVVDIGASVMSVYVMQDHRVIYHREQPAGGEGLTQRIVKTFGMPADQAERGKLTGELPEEYQTTVLPAHQRMLADQINQALQYFFANSHHNAIDLAVLVGGGSLVGGLSEAVADALGTPTVLGNLFESMSSAGRVNRAALLRNGPLYAVACGLALRSLDP